MTKLKKLEVMIKKMGREVLDGLVMGKVVMGEKEASASEGDSLVVCVYLFLSVFFKCLYVFICVSLSICSN